MTSSFSSSTMCSSSFHDVFLTLLFHVSYVVWMMSSSVTPSAPLQLPIHTHIQALPLLQQERADTMDTDDDSQQNEAAVVESFCERDPLQVNCLQDEAILITYARYGRMREGRCITKAYGAIGCSTDVMHILDAVCSGRRHCDVNVASLMRGRKEPCPTDFRSYLDVSYKCVKVAYAEESVCRGSGAVELRQPRGYLSNLITDEKGCGTIDNPWWVSASPGQRIHFTLFDFAQPGPAQPGGAPSVAAGPQTCHVYAVIKEEEWKRRETICGGGASSARQHVVYTSSGRLVEVRMTTNNLRKQTTGRMTYFLLRYEAFGCADPAIPRHGWMHRTDGGFDLGCNSSQDAGRVWRIQCHGTEWRGVIPNCTADVDDMQLGWTSVGQTSVASLTLVLCIAVFVGVVILGGGLFYLRRKEAEVRSSQLGIVSGSLIIHDAKQTTASASAAAASAAAMSYDLGGQYVVDSSCSATNDYFHGAFRLDASSSDRCTTTRPSTGTLVSFGPGGGYDAPSSYDQTTTMVDHYDHQQQIRYVEHIYDSPKFNRRSGRTADDVALSAAGAAETPASAAGEEPFMADDDDDANDFANVIY